MVDKNWPYEIPKTLGPSCFSEIKSVYFNISQIVPLFHPNWIPDSLTREDGSVNPNTKHPCQTVPPGLPNTPYLSKIPLFLGPQFQIGLLINLHALEWNSWATTSNCYH
jgi:hypothetical protein